MGHRGRPARPPSRADRDPLPGSTRTTPGAVDDFLQESFCGGASGGDTARRVAETKLAKVLPRPWRAVRCRCWMLVKDDVYWRCSARIAAEVAVCGHRKRRDPR